MTFMVKIKSLKKHKFTKILRLKWDFMDGPMTPSHFSVKIVELLSALKIHLFEHEVNVDLDDISIISSFKGISLLLLTPQLNILPISEKKIYGYIFGMKVIMEEDSNSNIMLFKHKNKLMGEIKILNYE